MTRKQSLLLRYIREYQAQCNGATPSYQEMVDALELGSKNNAHRMLGCLQRDGWIERKFNATRSIRILHEPERAAS